MNAAEAGEFDTGFGVGPVSYDDNDRVGVGALRLVRVQQGDFIPVTDPFNSATFQQIHPSN